jgi:hypothetical protein
MFSPLSDNWKTKTAIVPMASPFKGEFTGPIVIVYFPHALLNAYIKACSLTLPGNLTLVVTLSSDD